MVYELFVLAVSHPPMKKDAHSKEVKALKMIRRSRFMRPVYQSQFL
jgi:hypothetical protein